MVCLSSLILLGILGNSLLSRALAGKETHICVRASTLAETDLASTPPSPIFSFSRFRVHRPPPGAQDSAGASPRAGAALGYAAFDEGERGRGPKGLGKGRGRFCWYLCVYICMRVHSRARIAEHGGIGSKLETCTRCEYVTR
ncbi:hypothetical protein GGS23DRAFT_586578 [Durotheca rogersii]|uniref:uncharacterized protein n=1 Tax=Durotheca rogersii TaxID=419775 RepID=UPI00221F165D|nr:uncharacterized protein GGS23DRAFT_586578 [Durotheca rogersii]KAI5859310.1 hypothetical protein GGS23DRAFT_586578 [Durotheca rogersii]